MHAMHSERLTYHPVEPAALDAFHALVQDEHVRRFLLDGYVFDRTWSEERIRDSQALFERRGVGLWLARETVSGEMDSRPREGEGIEPLSDRRSRRHSRGGGNLAERRVVGFCGFLEIPSVCAEPQLVYALYERFTGRGYGTEMARAAMAHARSNVGFTEILAGVDEINAASLRVLQKLGFVRMSTQSGSFGNTYLMLHAGEGPTSSTR